MEIDWDSDRDGIADAWEEKRGLDPRNPDDRNQDSDGDGYTNLDEYMKSLVPDMIEVMSLDLTVSSLR